VSKSYPVDEVAERTARDRANGDRLPKWRPSLPEIVKK
jgi:hypothetical protein